MAQTISPTRRRSGNPALNERFVDSELVGAPADARTMSVGGVSAKTLLLLAVVIAGGAWGWSSATAPVGADVGQGYANTTVTIPGGFWLASFAAFGFSIAVIAAPRRAALFGLLYAVLEGFCLGAISAAFDAQTDGIVGAAVVSTLCVFAVALFLYATRIIRPTQRMAFAVAAGIGGLLLLYLFVFVLSIFNWHWLYSAEFRSVGIVVTLIAIALAAMSLMLDFATIEAGVEAGAPKQLEWYMAFSLTVTLVWLYLEILRLISYFQED